LPACHALTRVTARFCYVNLEIPAATQLGTNQSSAAAAGLYAAGGSASGGVGDVSGNSYAITTGGAGAFTAATVGAPIVISGSAGNANLTSVATNESAKNIAASINALTSQTNVTASADTSVAFTVTAGSISFVLGNGNDGVGGQTNTANIAATVSSATQSGLQPLVDAINQQTGTTGVTAAVNSGGQLVLTQAQGDNISITGFAGTGTLKAGGTAAVTLAAGGTTSATVQGLVTAQSNQAFALSATASDIGLNTASSLSSLAGVNVSTISGANSALNVVSSALQQLENVGAQLGALQQRLQATVSNLQTTDTNLTTARSVVQDANIPQVTTQLTQQQILQQAGVSALSQSNALQQSFLKLLQQAVCRRRKGNPLAAPCCRAGSLIRMHPDVGRDQHTQLNRDHIADPAGEHRLSSAGHRPAVAGAADPNANFSLGKGAKYAFQPAISAFGSVGYPEPRAVLGDDLAQRHGQRQCDQ
jgi:flagellin